MGDKVLADRLVGFDVTGDIDWKGEEQIPVGVSSGCSGSASWLCDFLADARGSANAVGASFEFIVRRQGDGAELPWRGFFQVDEAESLLVA
ncbi:hypothetical protein [Nocardia fluminea]|uniref:hypothetical protein n=1 Tax=Nocardia fluminea TaxID=134984 RepID=UPI000C714D29|nr:hypothetical protein [Nocardia fluminea]